MTNYKVNIAKINKKGQILMICPNSFRSLRSLMVKQRSPSRIVTGSIPVVGSKISEINECVNTRQSLKIMFAVNKHHNQNKYSSLQTLKKGKKETAMNKLTIEKQTTILSALVEGNSIRSIERMTGVHRDTIMRLLESAGQKAQEILDSQLNNITSNFIQVDEIWTFVGKKQKNLTTDERYYENSEFGDQYVFVALDAETKLVTNYTIGKRSYENTLSFLQDLNARVVTRFQLSSDSFKPYQNTVRRTFGNDIDYAQIHKVFGEEHREEKRYSPAQITGINIIPISGEPKEEHISTSYIERQNLTMRMQMRRFTRLTNAFSKKLENLKYAVALHFFHYNFIRVHTTLRATPAMVAGLTKTIWNWNMFLNYQNYAKVA